MVFTLISACRQDRNKNPTTIFMFSGLSYSTIPGAIMYDITVRNGQWKIRDGALQAGNANISTARLASIVISTTTPIILRSSYATRD
jgi:hypothetical protein